MNGQKKTVYDSMLQHGTTYDSIQEHTGLPRPTIRKLVGELLDEGKVVRGSKPGLFRIVVEEQPNE